MTRKFKGLSPAKRAGLVAALAAVALGVPTAILAQRAPAPTELSDVPSVRQVGTVDIGEHTVPLYRGRDALRAAFGERGGVVRLAEHGLQLLIPPGVGERTVAVQAINAWPCKWQPLRRIGPAVRLVGEMSLGDEPLVLSMHAEDLEVPEDHRLVLVATEAADEGGDSSRFVKIELPTGAARPEGARHALKVTFSERPEGSRRAIKIASPRLRTRASLDGKGNDVVTARSRPHVSDAPDQWMGTVSGARVHVVEASYDPRSDVVTARFHAPGNYESFELGVVPERAIESSLRSIPGRLKSGGSSATIRR